MLGAIAPAELAIPDTVLTLLAPNANQVTPRVELFGSQTEPAFDELSAARVGGYLDALDGPRLSVGLSPAGDGLTVGWTARF